MSFLRPAHAGGPLSGLRRGLSGWGAEVRQHSGPESEVSYILRTKRVFVQLKEELGTSPRFFYYFDV